MDLSRRDYLALSNRSLTISFWVSLVIVGALMSVSYGQNTEVISTRKGGLDDPPVPPQPWIDLNYPTSRFLTGVTLDAATRRTEAPGSDIWPITWADDGHQYTAFGDGGGFRGTNQEGRVSMGITRIEGDQDNYTGINVWGGKDSENPAQFTGKGTGILSVDGVLYMWVGRPKLLEETVLAVSSDHSRSWQLADWHWSMQDHLFAGVFVNCGRDHTGAPDDYVYACFSRMESLPAETRSWIYERPGRLDLARAPKNRLQDKSAWRWFAGVGQDQLPIWTRDLDARRPAFEDANGIKVVSMSYQPALRRYLLAYSPRDNGGNFALFEAAQPWGPWNQVAYWSQRELFRPPSPNRRVSTFHFAPKWWSGDGHEFTLVFNVGDDAWNTVRGRFEVAVVPDQVP